MNQHRWNCLTALFLSTVIAPISSVRAEVLSPVVGEAISPPSSPTTSPLTTTQLKTETAVPLIQAVPEVSALPILTPSGKIKTITPSRKLKIARAVSFPVQNSPAPAPISPSFTEPSVFNPALRASKAIVSMPSSIEQSSHFVNDTSVPVSSVVPLPQVNKGSARVPTKIFTSQVTSEPIFVTRSDNSQLTKGKLPTTITNSATVRAEIVTTPIVVPEDSRSATATIAPSERTETSSVPQVAPIASYKDKADLPSFEAGSPVFIFEEERPQQIVATVIAQVDDKIVAPEPSIAIPVERPKQQTIPFQSISPTPTIVKVEPAEATSQPVLDNIVSTQTGKASWYGSEGGPKTANGERYNPNGLTAAHRTLPFGTKVRVTNLKTGKNVIVRINDRGPFRGNRIIDISAGAAEVIGLKSAGVGQVRVDILEDRG
ncbi:septal ring lytic transglycosylase RlpA family protein [Chamaesiphon sp. VAR_48_metabat_403]|uniref:septal ring lytic transglycosylase RlpA family protein n=1 Tax=Chamaesiphon sp. VAR_48_metabat_403 TaxID=2964700 RepID=UPI00286DBDB6|nr:septal ring lytic transglycosylase RlpA family protein [Chamaesiphon sp. VAR_48_metabat_403]